MLIRSISITVDVYNRLTLFIRLFSSMRSQCWICLHFDIFVNVWVLLSVILLCWVFIKVHWIYYRTDILIWSWCQVNILFSCNYLRSSQLICLCLRNIFDSTVDKVFWGLWMILLNGFILFLQIHIRDRRHICVKRVLKWIWNINWSMSIHSGFFILIGLCSCCRTCF